MAAGSSSPASSRVALAAILAVLCATCVPALGAEFPRDGSVIELDDSNFDAAVATFDILFVDFYAPWCGHCKRLAPELDKAAPELSGLHNPIFVAKIDADKYRKLATKHQIDGFPTLKLFIHGVPIEYTGPRKADLLMRYLKKFAAPDVSVLDSDSSIRTFVGAAGTDFPLFIGFGLEESVLANYAGKYKKNAWFSIAKDFSEDMMVVYDFDKVPALVAIHPKYNEQSVFYGPFDGNFVEDFIKQSLLPLTVPITPESLKSMSEDDRKIVLTIVEDESDEQSIQLVKVLRSAANANRDLVFGYVGVKQWEEFADTFEATGTSQLPKILIWDGEDDYQLVEGVESLDGDDQASQVSRFLEGYREGRTTKKKVKGPSFGGFVKSLMNLNGLMILIFVVALLVALIYIGGLDDQPRRRTPPQEEPESSEASTVTANTARDKED